MKDFLRGLGEAMYQMPLQFLFVVFGISFIIFLLIVAPAFRIIVMLLVALGLLVLITQQIGQYLRNL